MREWFRVEAAAKGKGGGEILIYAHIGKRYSQDTDAVDARAFVEALDGLVKGGPGDIHIRINSPGGDVGAGMAIYNALRRHQDRVYTTIEGAAYSMASVIALAGRETRMADVGQFMVHNPTTVAWGGQKEMERAIAQLKTARSTLIKAYTKKTGKPVEDIESLMDETTFMTADEAKAFGFVDVIVDGDTVSEGAVAACFDALAWAAYHLGEGPMPVDAVHEVKSEIPAADGSGAGAEDGGAVAAETGAVVPEESGMKASQIRELCPGASAEFVLAQVEAAEQNEAHGEVAVLKAWNAEQAKVIAAKDAEKAEAVKAAEAKAQAPGVQPLPSGQASEGEADEDPIAAWETAVATYEKRGMDRAKAIREVCIKQKDLHASYLRAYNAAVGRNHLAG